MIISTVSALTVLLIMMSSVSLNGQAVGFGCLGFVGGFGGFSYQRYDPAGLNQYIDTFNDIRTDSLTTPMAKFGSSKGYRLGINFFRANLEGFILTTKGFYQYLSEKHEASILNEDGSSSTSFKVEMKNWALGVDLGTSITRALSWKVIDAALLYSSAALVETNNYPNAVTDVDRYKTESSTFGYSIGTGFILEVIDEYVTLEGLAGYTVMTIDKLKEDEIYLTVSEIDQQPMENFIEAGGFNAVIQLNIGFPL